VDTDMEKIEEVLYWSSCMHRLTGPSDSRCRWPVEISGSGVRNPKHWWISY
jgi:hypothetical protein